MDNGSLTQGAEPGQSGPTQFIENYLRSFDTAEAEAARSKDPQVAQLLQRLRARRPRTLAELATKAR